MMAQLLPLVDDALCAAAAALPSSGPVEVMADAVAYACALHYGAVDALDTAGAVEARAVCRACPCA
jgi:hypothetical protein